ncbi:hypothetical protein V865_004241 [Kwoniella europaea PYCC6329]|uniref:Uncharacterized protein n=1 Tax=Kwoniella europaea PYCC6329 TaxID=1423913 RepID=A0AAX4KI20_9TREE
MDTLAKSLLQDAISIASRRNSTMVLELYPISTGQIAVTPDGSSTRQVPYDEARRISAGDSDDRDWEERRPGLQLFVMEIAVPHENQE